MHSKDNTSAGGEKIGELGGTVNINKIYGKLLAKNALEAKGLKPYQWVLNVKKDGKWDLKNTYNKDGETGEETIFGIAWQFDEDSKEKTKFNFYEYSFSSAADVGNHHAGYTGTFTGIPTLLQKIGAGYIEKFKMKQYGVLLPYYPAFTVPFTKKAGMNMNFWSTFSSWPFGDAVKDVLWNTRGMRDAKTIQGKLNE